MSNIYGDISPRTAAFAVDRMLERALPRMCLSRFGQQQPIPKNKTNACKWRRYNNFLPSLVPLIEGVTPAPDLITYSDVTATLSQYGRRIQISDVILDTHEDPVLMEHADIMGEGAAQTAERVIFNAIRGGTNVEFTAGGSRIATNSAITTAMLNRCIRRLKRQNAKPVSRMLAGTDKVGSAPIRPAFVAFCHPDLQVDLEALTETGGAKAFRTTSEYGSFQPLNDAEIGSYRDIRFMTSTLFDPWLAAGTSNSGNTTLLTNGGSGTGSPDVYPLIIMGENAFATVSLAGANAFTPMVSNPKVSDSDPLGQRAHVAFKMYMTAAILNDAWMIRAECGVTQ